MPLSPAERTLRAKLAAHSVHARGRTNTEPARAAFDQRFFDEVDPDRVLPSVERAKRAAHARSAYFSRLAMKAATARRRKAQASDNNASEGPDAE
ncbi:MAG: hypothetical protein V3S30_05115 [Thermoanaerobaculia bacterium]